MTAESISSGQRAATWAVGVPRRFGVGALVLMLTVYAVLFRSLAALGANSLFITVAACFFSGVAIAQAWLFGGRDPRRASLLSGAILLPVSVVVLSITGLAFGVAEVGKQEPHQAPEG